MQASAAMSLADGWSVRLGLSSARDDSSNTSSVPFSFSNGDFESTNRAATLSTALRLADGITANAAYEYLQQRGGATSYDPDYGGQLTSFERSVGSLRAGIEGRAGPHRFQGNVRYDDYSDFGGVTTGLAAYGYDFAGRWRLSLQLASAFRAPSFSDLYFPGYGNPDLSPERSRTGELSLRYGGESASWRAAVFSNRITDLIVYDFAAGKAGNIASADIRGVELLASANVGGWQLQADAAYTKAEDATTGERLLRRAPYNFHVAASRTIGQWQGLAEVNYSARRDDADINTFVRTSLDAYWLARLALSWRPTPAVQLMLRLENVFDATYELVDGYNTAGFGAFFGVTLRLP
jgi:vitamin B12 transporter